jgi:hypothetical protein
MYTYALFETGVRRMAYLCSGEANAAIPGGSLGLDGERLTPLSRPSGFSTSVMRSKDILERTPMHHRLTQGVHASLDPSHACIQMVQPRINSVKPQVDSLDILISWPWCVSLRLRKDEGLCLVRRQLGQEVIARLR